ncbi:FtsX-like permease family protein [Clostridium sp. YIM B02505]|uniref:FtsX-like permease family protein n=1 Tax=Clostridium yunnanense TaxID=2800325 RepID=A0ABS1ETM4_9CLOT|nr:FtsX-like permease family protein [Clostridium yunnanense]MBK1812752.1 FtsX-like permease family protein [Clostridium yunnanense]
MFFRILKKDFKRKKSMNIILLLFIIMATTFLASSVNNLIAVSRSVDYFMNKAKTPDYIISAYDKGENEELYKWLNSSKYIESHDIDKTTILSKDNIKIKTGDTLKEFNPYGQILFQAQPQNYGKMLDDNGDEINLKAGEIAFSLGDKRKNNLEIGDTIIITLGNIKKEFLVKTFIKDAIFGSSMVDMKRILISDEDYQIFKEYKEAGAINNYYIISKDTNALEKEFKNIECNTIISFDKALLNTTFILDMIPSGVLIIVSLCLILIAFLILRFTIIFTMQDDLKEIGVMKAIGLRGFDIKKIYLIKYIAITVVGVLIGFAASFPFGNIFLNQFKGNILMESSAGNIFVNIGCSVLIVFIVILFCYLCTRRLNKLSAIDAIRNGSNGESFKGKTRLKFKSFKKVKVPMFIALNDILCNIKRFVVLILTFCIGTVLIIIPLNTINTFKDDNIIRLFGFNRSDVFIQTDKMDKYTMGASKAEYISDMDSLTKSFKDNGIDTKLYGSLIYRLKFYVEDKNDTSSLMSFQTIKNDEDNINLLKGKMPELKNELAVTETVAKKLKASVGDTIYTQIGKEKKEFIITGLYENMNNMGESVRLNPKIDIDFNYLVGVGPFQGDFIGKEKPELSMDKLKIKYPNYTFQNSKEYISKYIGGTMSQLDTMKNLIALIVVCINGLITVLMMKTFITKEKGEIAMLKSIGFRNSSIRFWQAARISIVLIVAITLGIILSDFLGPLAIGQVFAVLGVHNIILKVNPLEVYGIYPIMILVVTTVIAYLSAGAVKKVDLKEINNME